MGFKKHDPATGFPIIEMGNHEFKLAYIPSTHEEKSKYPKLMSSGLIGDDEIREIDLSESYPYIEISDQNSWSACSGFASANAIMYARAVGGQKYVRLSHTFPYAFCNGGSDNGATIDCLFNTMKTNGTCPVELNPDNQIWKSRISSKAIEEAKKYRLIEAYSMEGFQPVLKSISKGLPTVIGVMIGSNFTNIDSRGIAPAPRGSKGGHAMCVVGCKKFDNRWFVKIVNSWTAQFGLNGYAYLGEEFFQEFADAYALVAAIDDPDDRETDPPVVKN